MRRTVPILALLFLVLGTTTAHASEACTSAPLSPFVDVRRSSVHARSIDCLYWYRVTTGTGVDTFTPGGTVTRDQMASFVVRVIAAAGRPLPPPGDAFTDLAGNVHRRPIERLRAAQLVHGIASDRYGPKLEVPRGQMTAFLVRTWRYVTQQAFPPARDAFEDDDGHRFEGDINVAYALGLAKGRSSGEFDPDGLTSRAEMASFLTRLIERLRLDGHLSSRTVGFESRVRALPTSLERLMVGSSWRTGCPVGLDDLRLLELTHRDFSGAPAWGLLVVHQDSVEALRGVFEELYVERFEIARMRLVDRYGADDQRSMAANNTSAFNCRRVAGTMTWSQHAYGRAIDINPIQNPYVRGSTVEPPSGSAYLDRSDVRPGMVVRPGPVVTAFERLGWGWGGDWTSSKDYQHFSARGR